MARYQDPNNPTAPSGGVDLTPYRAPVAAPQTAQMPTFQPYRMPSYPTTSQTPYGQAGYQAPRFPGFTPTTEFSHDPTTSNYESLMNYQIPYYMQPIAQRDYLGQSAPQYGQLLGAIQNILAQTAGASPGESMLLSLAGSLAGGGNADAYANEYRSQLKQEPFTGAEAEAYKTEFTDPLQAQKTVALQRAMREISDQGIDPSSGIAQAKLNEVARTFDQAQAQAQNSFAINANKLRSERQGQAFQAGLSAEQIKNQARSAAMSGASGAANAWANRMGMGLEAAGLGNTAALQRAQMGYGVDSALRGEQTDNFTRAMTLAQIMSQLPSQRQAEALSLIQMGDPSSVLQGTNAIANQRQNQAQIANQTYANTWGGLGSMLGYLGQMFPTSGAGGGYTGTVNGGAGGAPMLPGNAWPGFTPTTGSPWALTPSQSYAGYMTGLPR